MKKVLIIDDDQNVLEMMQLVLSDAGYLVQIENRGGIIDTLTETDLPDLVILDVFLLQENGFELAQRLKVQELTKYTPILMMSSEDGMKSKADKEGSPFINKPFTIDSLLYQVAYLLGSTL
jgi:DNA-binding response OmpR family regulator